MRSSPWVRWAALTVSSFKRPNGNLGHGLADALEPAYEEGRGDG